MTRSNQGQTLLELVCAIAVFSTGILGSLQFASLCIEYTRVTQENALALEVLENEVEVLRSRFETSSISAGETGFASATPGLETLHKAAGFVRIEDAGVPGLYDVELELRWVSSGGRIAVRSLATRMAHVTAREQS